MKKMLIIAFTFFTIGSAQAGERLNNEQLKALYTGKTLINENLKLGPVKTYFAEDGTVQSKADSGEERIGEWWIDGDQRCIRWNNKNKDFCLYTEKNEDGTHSMIHSKSGKKTVLIKEALDGNQL